MAVWHVCVFLCLVPWKTWDLAPLVYYECCRTATWFFNALISEALRLKWQAIGVTIREVIFHFPWANNLRGNIQDYLCTSWRGDFFFPGISKNVIKQLMSEEAFVYFTWYCGVFFIRTPTRLRAVWFFWGEDQRPFFRLAVQQAEAWSNNGDVTSGGGIIGQTGGMLRYKYK